MVELNNFQDDGSGHYKAIFGHDDMVMAEVQLTFVTETLQYKLFKEEFEASVDAVLPDNIYNPFETEFFPSQISDFNTWFNSEEEIISNMNKIRLLG